MYIDNEGNIYLEAKQGLELTEVCIELPDESLEGYIGEIWFDERNHCVVDDREKAYFYKYEDGELVKYDWRKRYECGEFTIEDLRMKVLRALRSNYIRDVQQTDSIFIAYQKRDELGILEVADSEEYSKALEYYKGRTLAYRSQRDRVMVSEGVDDLISLFNSLSKEVSV